MVKNDPTLAPTPTFTPTRQVSSSPLPETSHDWPSLALGTVWADHDIFQYIRSATPTPEGSPDTPPETSPVATPDRSLTPSPILGVFTAERRPVAYGPVYRPAPAPPPLALLPPIMPPLGFVHDLPTQLAPNTRTPTYVTPNGKVTYYVYAEADGVARVCMAGLVVDLHDIYASLAAGQRRMG